MSKLVIVVEVTDVDPSLVDPHDIAENVVNEYNDSRSVSAVNDPEVVFVSAEWEQA